MTRHAVEPAASCDGVARVLVDYALRSNQLQRLEAGVPVLAHDDVVMHRDAKRARDLDDRLRHLDIGARWGWIA
jgi:hypothetical protein